MSSAKFTLLGFYQYNENLFDELVLPDGVDKDTLIDSILMRGAEYEVVYSDPGFMQKLIGSWSRQWLHVFEKWKEVTDTEFKPLENYDRYEDFSDTSQLTGEGSTSGSDSANATGQTSAYNSSGFTNADNSITSATTRTDSNTKSNEVKVHTAHIHGNIGVTTSSAMYREFYELMLQYGNIYNSIATVFLQSFVIPVL